MDKHHEAYKEHSDTDRRAGGLASGDGRRGGTDKARRRLLQGAAATSAVYALATRPVLAQGGCTSSVLMSGNVSLHPDQEGCRLGCSPGYWKNNSEACWETLDYNGPISPTTLFTDIFLTNVALEDVPSDLKVELRDILWLNGNGGFKVKSSGNGNEAKHKSDDRLPSSVRQAAVHAVAAFLNAAHPEVNGQLFPNNNGYPYRSAEIINDFDNAFSDYLNGFGMVLTNHYDDYDSRQCPLSNHCR